MPKLADDWTTTSWNPTTGCDRISTGCDHCYALKFAERLQAMGQPRYQADGDPRTSGPGFGLTLHHDLVDLPRRWRRARHIFVGSMSDLFHKDVPLDFIQAVVATMRATPQHTYQVLTKRAKRLATLSKQIDWPANVWLGTSVESARQLPRVDHLRRVEATVRFIAAEPLIGPLDALDLGGIHWLTVAGEAGPGARAMDPAWVRGLRDAAIAHEVPFFFLQWGGSGPPQKDRILDGRVWEQRPGPSGTPPSRPARQRHQAPSPTPSASPV